MWHVKVQASPLAEEDMESGLNGAFVPPHLLAASLPVREAASHDPFRPVSTLSHPPLSVVLQISQQLHWAVYLQRCTATSLGTSGLLQTCRPLHLQTDLQH